MTDTANLLSIGEFSSRSRLSVRMLRHYDEHGVLPPAAVDPFTGYRRYAREQLAVAVQIRRLRDVGFTVSAIAAVLAARGTPAYDAALRLQRLVLADELHAATDRLALLDQLLDQKGHTMSSISITRAQLPARTVVALRGTVATYADEGQLWARFMPALAAQGIAPIGPGGCIEHDADYKESEVDESVYLPVPPGTTAAEPLHILELPAQDVVMARVEGPYALITEAHGRIEEAVRDNGWAVADRAADAPVHHKVFNRYLNDPRQVPPEALLTEVCVPLA